MRKKTDSLPLSIRINVGLSFLFMLVAVPLLLWTFVVLFAPGATFTAGQMLIFCSPIQMGVLVIGAVLGLANALGYYMRAKSRLTK